ncbi:MAG: sugar ABC transporter ATP-binding protein, partial [Clostridiales bacterium]|nr:sugar ABC transporter ATP-binding protein [Clostridiales bacterium]
LMKIIMGIYQPDEGELVIAGGKISTFKPSVILAKGVYMVPQEPMLFPNMTVEENVLIGFKEKTGPLRKRLIQIMDDIGWHLDLTRKAMSLSIAEQQLVELLRGLLRNARVLILDEPTSALTFDEVESLFKIVEDLKQKGIGIIYITHRLAEVFQIATHVAIMRDGIITLKGRVADFSREMLVKGLLPPNMDESELKDGKDTAGSIHYEGLKPVFELQHYSGYGFEDVNLKVYPGEVLGVAGVVGAGRTELATTIFGRDKVLKGKAILDGKDVTGLSTAEVLKAGINYVPEDRRLNGLFGISDVAANTTSSLLMDKKMGGFFLDRKAEREVAQRYIDDFRIKVTGQDQTAGSLSGGNQQKIVIGRSLST